MKLESLVTVEFLVYEKTVPEEFTLFCKIFTPAMLETISNWVTLYPIGLGPKFSKTLDTDIEYQEDGYS